MHNFIILFQEKEGTTAMVNLLKNIEQICYVSQKDNKGGWEPFNKHNCGEMPISEYCSLIDKIFNSEEIDTTEINALYTKRGKGPLDEIDKSKSVGFKLRFWPPIKNPLKMLLFFPYFERMMLKLLKKNKVKVFLAVRQDIFRWGLSKYHGDGTGKKGHIQFKLAEGKIKKDEIGKIRVKPLKFELILKSCELRHWRKKRLLSKMKCKGLDVFPLMYEDFLESNEKVLKYMLDKLEIEYKQEDLTRALEKGTKFKKVHSNDIAEFVENHEEINKKFGRRMVSWKHLMVK